MCLVLAASPFLSGCLAFGLSGVAVMAMVLKLPLACPSNPPFHHLFQAQGLMSDCFRDRSTLPGLVFISPESSFQLPPARITRRPCRITGIDPRLMQRRGARKPSLASQIAIPNRFTRNPQTRT